MEMGECLRGLRKLRRAKDLSQRELADMVGVHQVTIRRWEAGESIPGVDDIVKLSEALDTTVNSLMGDDERAKTASEAVLSCGTDTPADPRVDMRYWGEVFDRAEAAAARRDMKELLRVRLMLKESLDEVNEALNFILSQKIAG